MLARVYHYRRGVEQQGLAFLDACFSNSWTFASARLASARKWRASFWASAARLLRCDSFWASAALFLVASWTPCHRVHAIACWETRRQRMSTHGCLRACLNALPRLLGQLSEHDCMRCIGLCLCTRARGGARSRTCLYGTRMDGCVRAPPPPHRQVIITHAQVSEVVMQAVAAVAAAGRACAGGV